VEILMKKYIPVEMITTKSLRNIDFNLPDDELERRYKNNIRQNGEHSKLRFDAFNPVTLETVNNVHELQYNFCSYPFCSNFGLSDLEDRYFNYYNNDNEKSIKCIRKAKKSSNKGLSRIDHSTSLISNSGVANEIKRLSDLDDFKPFSMPIGNHSDDCIYQGYSPSTSVGVFTIRDPKRNKYQCIYCKRYTNSTSPVFEPTSKLRKKNLTVELIKSLMTEKKVRGFTKEKGIGMKTFYDHIDIFYNQCLYFLEIHERNLIRDLQLDEINYLTTDSFDVKFKWTRKKGHGGIEVNNRKPVTDTRIVSTVLNKSGYVLRSDMSFDTKVTFSEVKKRVQEYRDDLVPPYLRVYDNYKFLNPTNGKKIYALDSKSVTKSISYMASFFDGMPINERYTNYAHHFLIKEMLGKRKLVYICDRDDSLNNAIIRNNKDEVLSDNTYVFNFKINKDLKKHEAEKYARQKEVKFKLLHEKVTLTQHIEPVSLLEKLMEQPYKEANKNHYSVDNEKYTDENGKEQSLRKNTFFEYPLPLKEEGERFI
jgi:hypothetical protein